MAQAACACVPVWRGMVITKDGHLGGALPPLELAEAGHPVPDARAFAAARRALALTQGLTAEDTGPRAAVRRSQRPVRAAARAGGAPAGDHAAAPAQRADIAAMNAVRKRPSPP